jgi:hypothetical protein
VQREKVAEPQVGAALRQMMWFCLREAASLSPASNRHAYLHGVAYGWLGHWFGAVVASPPAVERFDWDRAFGAGGATLVQASEKYDFGAMHADIAQTLSCPRPPAAVKRP